MRQCPECRRVYYDERLNFCLDDGAALLHGPGNDEPATAILSTSTASDDVATASLSEPGVAATGSSVTAASDPVATALGSDSVAKLRTGFDKRLLLAPVALALIVLAGLAGYRYLNSAQTGQINSIAVLPFVNESGSGDVEYLSDGISETLINSLTQLPNLTVKPRSSAFRYKGRESEAKAIGSELGVGAIITGRLTQRGDDISLFVRLVDTGSENQIWGKQYQRKLANLVTLQTEIARDVSDSLRTRLTGVGEKVAQKTYATNPEAYRLYLQGRYHWNKRSRRDIELAIDYFKQSTARDPGFAPAFAGLADSLSIIGGYTGATAHETIAEARSAALTSMSLDSDSAESHNALGTIFFYYDHNFVEAEREFTRAIELDPKNGHARHMLGLVLTSIGRLDEGLESYRSALELEPVSLPFNRGYALALTYARKLGESEVQFRKTIELDPSFGLAYFGFAYTLSLQGKFAEAVDAYAKGAEVAGAADRAVNLRRSFASGGWKTFLHTLLEHPPLQGTTPTPNFIRALYLIQLGDKEAALDELKRSYEKREGFITLVKVHPGLDAVRDDSRYKELLKKVGLPE